MTARRLTLPSGPGFLTQAEFDAWCGRFDTLKAERRRGRTQIQADFDAWCDRFNALKISRQGSQDIQSDEAAVGAHSTSANGAVSQGRNLKTILLRVHSNQSERLRVRIYIHGSARETRGGHLRHRRTISHLLAEVNTRLRRSAR